MTTVIVFHEKHGDVYYDASTPELQAGAFYEILKDRFDAGWYHDGDDEYQRMEAILSEPIEKAIYIGHETPRGRFISDAEDIIDLRSDWEYEGYDIIGLNKAEIG